MHFIERLQLPYDASATTLRGTVATYCKKHKRTLKISGKNASRQAGTFWALGKGFKQCGRQIRRIFYKPSAKPVEPVNGHDPNINSYKVWVWTGMVIFWAATGKGVLYFLCTQNKRETPMSMHSPDLCLAYSTVQQVAIPLELASQNLVIVL